MYFQNIRRILSRQWLSFYLVEPLWKNHEFNKRFLDFKHILNTFSMMTSSNINIFRVTGHLCGEFTGSPHKGQWRGSLMFSLICVWISGWENNREAGDLRRYCAHYDVIIMGLIPCMDLKNSRTIHLNCERSMWWSLVRLKARYIQNHNHHKISAVHVLGFFTLLLFCLP